MLILGISSGGDILEAALIEGEKPLAVHGLTGKLNTEELIGNVDLVFSNAGRKIGELSAIAVTIGPGSYSGLRGGLATAKGLAEVLGKPIVEIDIIDAVSLNMAGSDSIVLLALPAKKDEYNAAIFSCAAPFPERLTENFVASSEKLARALAKVGGMMHLVCPRDEIFNNIKKLNPSTKIEQSSSEKAFPRAISAAKIGLKKFLAGEISDPVKVIPRYSHEPNIREFRGL